MKYQERDLVKIAKRENNSKRNYLVVDPLQGKHVPVTPSAALNLFKNLAAEIQGKYEGERLLLIGFAETATAIGAGDHIGDKVYPDNAGSDTGCQLFVFLRGAQPCD